MAVKRDFNDFLTGFKSVKFKNLNKPPTIENVRDS